MTIRVVLQRIYQPTNGVCPVIWKTLIFVVAFAFGISTSQAQRGTAPYRGASIPSASFTPAWQDFRLGAGGFVDSISVYPDGTMLSHNDTYGGHLFVPSGNCAYGGGTLAAPCWQQLVTATSLPASVAVPTLSGSGNLGAAELIACPSNTQVLYMLFNGVVYVSTNKGTTWVATPQKSTLNANSGVKNYHWIACDPNNPDIIYMGTPSAGAFRSTNGRSGGSSTWAQVTAVGMAAGANGHVFAYDPNSPVSGGVTQHFMICTYGAGCYETTNGGTSYTLTTSTPTTLRQIICDKFSQFWLVDGRNLFKYVSGSWSTITTGIQSSAIAADPNSVSSGANRLVIAKASGEVVVSIDNGGHWTGTTNNPSFSAPSPQPGWMATANQISAFLPFINVGALTFDASSNLWQSAGIGVWETGAPKPGSATAWRANTVGIEQLVTNQIISPPGNSPLAAVWDRGFYLVKNPDIFPSIQYPNSTSINQIEGGWAFDYASSTPNFITGIISSNIAPNSAPASSSDGGNTWVAWPSNPLTDVGGNIAASTTTNWVVVPGQNTALKYTTDGGTTWTPSTVSGSPSWINNYINNRMILAADRVTANQFYAVDLGNGRTGSQSFYRSTDSGATFTKIGTRPPFDGQVYQDVLLSVPGQAGHLFYTAGSQPRPPANTHLWKSTNHGTNWSPANLDLRNVLAFGFGAAKPGGSGYPMAYAVGWYNRVYGIYASSDGGTTWTAIDVPTNQQVWPGNSVDLITWITGDMNVYGRVYVGFRGSGGTYIDTQDACPWVNFSNTNPNASLTGTVTLTAQHSGLVPVSSVQFSVDGATVGSALTGAGPYSTSWNTGGTSTGVHTLTVATTGANCTGSFSIPITTH